MIIFGNKLLAYWHTDVQLKQVRPFEDFTNV